MSNQGFLGNIRSSKRRMRIVSMIARYIIAAILILFAMLGLGRLTVRREDDEPASPEGDTTPESDPEVTP